MRHTHTISKKFLPKESLHENHMILIQIHLLVDCKQGNNTRKHQNSNSFDMSNTCLKGQKCLPWCTGVHNGQRKWEHEAVSRVGRVGKEGGTRDRGTQAGQPGDQPDRRLTHWQVCAGWLEPGQHLRKPIIVPCLVPSQSVSHNVTESLHYGHPDPVLFSLVFSLQTL